MPHPSPYFRLTLLQLFHPRLPSPLHFSPLYSLSPPVHTSTSLLPPPPPSVLPPPLCFPRPLHSLLPPHSLPSASLHPSPFLCFPPFCFPPPPHLLLLLCSPPLNLPSPPLSIPLCTSASLPPHPLHCFYFASLLFDSLNRPPPLLRYLYFTPPFTTLEAQLQQVIWG